MEVLLAVQEYVVPVHLKDKLGVEVLPLLGRVNDVCIHAAPWLVIWEYITEINEKNSKKLYSAICSDCCMVLLYQVVGNGEIKTHTIFLLLNDTCKILYISHMLSKE